MHLTSGTIISGQVVLDDAACTDGTRVIVVFPDQEGQVSLALDERAELTAGIEEANRGQTIPSSELMNRLKLFG